jgi:hypothetical protein
LGDGDGLNEPLARHVLFVPDHAATECCDGKRVSDRDGGVVDVVPSAAVAAALLTRSCDQDERGDGERSPDREDSSSHGPASKQGQVAEGT